MRPAGRRLLIPGLIDEMKQIPAPVLHCDRYTAFPLGVGLRNLDVHAS